MSHETLGDLVATGAIDGRRVRYLGKENPYLEYGTEGVVQCAGPGTLIVKYERESLHEGHPWRKLTVESKLRYLELVS